MPQLVLMLEEPSMAAFLDGLLPRIFPGWQPGVEFRCIPHEGKSHLEKSLPKKLKAWPFKQDRFVVVRDNDGADCKQIKQRLQAICDAAARPTTLIRIACQELEAWYLGDLSAICKAFGVSADTQPNRKRYRNPDRLSQPSKEVKQLAPSFQKIAGARSMAAQLDLQQSGSESFNQFVKGVRRTVTHLGSE